VDEVDVGSQEQSRGIEQIATAVTQMEAVTQRSAASAEQSAAASEELAAQAQTLADIVDRVRQLVGGNRESATRDVATRRSPAPPAHTASHSADLSALGHSLHKAGRTKLVAPATASPSSVRNGFPLDDAEDNF
jgi:methyl-accepting chemotaxis protein